jgi:hypothetical protein
MNNPDHNSESLETIFGLKYLNSLMQIRDPGSGMEKHPGSVTLCKKHGFHSYFEREGREKGGGGFNEVPEKGWGGGELMRCQKGGGGRRPWFDWFLSSWVAS